jgi:hypothetical protein
VDDEATVKKTILIPAKEWSRFKERHPGHGDFTWFVREALTRYNEVNSVSPEELIQLAVSEIRLTD